MTELKGGAVIVDDMVYGSLKRPVDRLGRQQPRILGAFGILGAAVRCGMPAPIEVPAEFWDLNKGENGNSVAVVACPCGQEPQVEVGCMATCGCDRRYFFPVDVVLVFNSPKGKDPVATPVDPSEVPEPPSSELQSES